MFRPLHFGHYSLFTLDKQKETQQKSQTFHMYSTMPHLYDVTKQTNKKKMKECEWKVEDWITKMNGSTLPWKETRDYWIWVCVRSVQYLETFDLKLKFRTNKKKKGSHKKMYTTNRQNWFIYFWTIHKLTIDSKWQ